jgi:hypothetical protein
MLTIIMVWVALSIPISLVLGLSFWGEAPVELVGMDGDDAVFQRPDGTLERMPLGTRTSL